MLKTNGSDGQPEPKTTKVRYACGSCKRGVALDVPFTAPGIFPLPRMACNCSGSIQAMKVQQETPRIIKPTMAPGVLKCN